MRNSMFLALVIAAAFGCDRNRDQTTMHEARTQNTPAQQAAQNDNDVDLDNPNNRTLPDDADPQPQGQPGTQQNPGSPDVGNPTDPSGSNPTNPPPPPPIDPNDDIDDDLPPNTGPDTP